MTVANLSGLSRARRLLRPPPPPRPSPTLPPARRDPRDSATGSPCSRTAARWQQTAGEPTPTPVTVGYPMTGPLTASSPPPGSHRARRRPRWVRRRGSDPPGRVRGHHVTSRREIVGLAVVVAPVVNDPSRRWYGARRAAAGTVRFLWPGDAPAPCRVRSHWHGPAPEDAQEPGPVPRAVDRANMTAGLAGRYSPPGFLHRGGAGGR